MGIAIRGKVFGAVGEAVVGGASGTKWLEKYADLIYEKVKYYGLKPPFPAELAYEISFIHTVLTEFLVDFDLTEEYKKRLHFDLFVEEYDKYDDVLFAEHDRYVFHPIERFCLGLYKYGRYEPKLFRETRRVQVGYLFWFLTEFLRGLSYCGVALMASAYLVVSSVPAMAVLPLVLLLWGLFYCGRAVVYQFRMGKVVRMIRDFGDGRCNFMYRRNNLLRYNQSVESGWYIGKDGVRRFKHYIVIREIESACARRGEGWLQKLKDTMSNLPEGSDDYLMNQVLDAESHWHSYHRSSKGYFEALATVEWLYWVCYVMSLGKEG